MPDVDGDTRGRRAQRDRGRRASGVGKVTEEESDQDRRARCIDQSPAAGTKVDEGRRGQPDGGQGAPKVPDVTSDDPTAEDATNALEDAGFKVQVRDRRDHATDEDGRRRATRRPRRRRAALEGRDGHDHRRPARDGHADAHVRRPPPRRRHEGRGARRRPLVRARRLAGLGRVRARGRSPRPATRCCR